MKFNVLKPEFKKTFEKNEHGQNFFRVERWIVLGTVQEPTVDKAMQAAKRLHPVPVLEAVL